MYGIARSAEIVGCKTALVWLYLDEGLKPCGSLLSRRQWVAGHQPRHLASPHRHASDLSADERGGEKHMLVWRKERVYWEGYMADSLHTDGHRGEGEAADLDVPLQALVARGLVCHDAGRLGQRRHLSAMQHRRDGGAPKFSAWSKHV